MLLKLATWIIVDHKETHSSNIVKIVQMCTRLMSLSCRITLIGHSIGCRMLIDIVQRNTTHNFESRIINKLWLILSPLCRGVLPLPNAGEHDLDSARRSNLVSLRNMEAAPASYSPHNSQPCSSRCSSQVRFDIFCF